MSEIDKVNKYTNGKIYRIWNLLNDKFYVGSTVQPLHKRMIGHRSDAGRHKCSNVKLFEEMNTLGYEHFKIELIEYYPCQTKDELTRREGEVIRELKPDLNMQIAGRTTKEWVNDNRDHVRQKRKEYYEINKECVTAKQKEYNDKHREQLLNYTKQWYEANKMKMKADFKSKYEANPDFYREKARQYRKDHPEIIKEADRQKYQRQKAKGHS